MFKPHVAILMLRTYALYRRNKIVLSILLCYILAQIISTLLITLGESPFSLHKAIIDRTTTSSWDAQT